MNVFLTISAANGTILHITLPQSPVPAIFLPSTAWFLQPVSGLYNGAAYVFNQVGFFNGGGIVVKDVTGSEVLVQVGAPPQLYTGAESAPTLVLGDWVQPAFGDESTLPGPFEISIRSSNTPPPNFPLPFSKRTTSATAVFACLFIASPRGASVFPSTVAVVSALAVEYAQLFAAYQQLIHQPTANNEVDLDMAIASAVAVVKALNATLAQIPPAGPILSQMQVVAANSLANLLKVQTDENYPEPT